MEKIEYMGNSRAGSNHQRQAIAYYKDRLSLLERIEALERVNGSGVRVEPARGKTNKLLAALKKRLRVLDGKQ